MLPFHPLVSLSFSSGLHLRFPAFLITSPYFRFVALSSPGENGAPLLKGANMKRNRKILWLLLWALEGVILCCCPAYSWAKSAEDYTIESDGRFWRPRMDSTSKIWEANAGADLKTGEDLGMGERKNFSEGRVQVKFGQNHKLNLSYLPLKWGTDKVLTRPTEFSGANYQAGTRLQSKLDLQYYRAGYEYDFLAGASGFLGGAVDVLIADMKVGIKVPALSTEQREDRLAFIPMVGLIGCVSPVKWVNLTAKVSGLPLGDYGHAFDAEASLNFNPVSYLGISGGYRYFQTKARYDDNSVDFRFGGPFLNLNIRF